MDCVRAGPSPRALLAYHNCVIPNDPAARTVPSSGRPRWLLLVHAIPPKPDYLRVKIGRRLARIGAVALKNSVYLLPAGDEAAEDFQWVLREVVAGGGTCTICEAAFVGGLDDEGAVALFRDARNRDYTEIAADAARLREALGDGLDTAECPTDADAPPRGAPAQAAVEQAEALRAQVEGELARLRRRCEEVTAIDFFGAAGGPAAAAAVRDVEAALRAHVERAQASREDRARGGHGGGEPGGTHGWEDAAAVRGRRWVTRRGIKVDRIASAWLIRRFIDPAARFRFVAPDGYVPAVGELRFDMFDAEYTHEGARCTFETLVHRFGLDDPALAVLGEVVHDIDFKEHTFGREETAGVARLIDGLVATHAADDERLRHGAAVLDTLYAGLAAYRRGTARSQAR